MDFFLQNVVQTLKVPVLRKRIVIALLNEEKLLLVAFFGSSCHWPFEKGLLSHMSQSLVWFITCIQGHRKSCL